MENGVLFHLMELMEAETERKRANEIALLKYEVDFFKERAQEEQSRNITLRRKRAAQEAEMRSLSEQSIAIENGTDDNVRQCNEFTDNINRAQLSITELKETMKQEEEEFDQFCANYEKEMEEKQVLKQKIIDEYEELKLKWASTENNGRQQLVDFEAEKSSVVEKVARTEQEMIELQAKERNILDEIQKVKQRHEIEKSAWNAKSAAMERQKNAVKNELSEKKSERDVVNVTLADLTTDNAYFQSAVKELKDEMVKLDKNRELATAENENILKNIGDLQIQVEELNKSTAALSMTNETQLKETGSLEAKAKHLEQMLAELDKKKNKRQSPKQVAQAPLETNAAVSNDVRSVNKPIVHSSHAKRVSSVLSESGSKSRGKKQSLPMPSTSGNVAPNAGTSKRSADVAGKKLKDPGLKRLPSPSASYLKDDKDLDATMIDFLFGDDDAVDTSKLDDTFDNLKKQKSSYWRGTPRKEK